MTTKATTKTAPAHVSELTVEEMRESLTGHEENLAERVFGVDVYNTRTPRLYVSLVRALVFLAKCREGATPEAAKKAALDLTAKEVNDYFTPDEPELDDEKPETQQGKDDSSDA
jgi:hypothetical protein